MRSQEETEPPEIAPLAQAFARHWTDEPATFVRWFRNAVYRVETSEGTGYLRVTPAGARTREHLTSELSLLTRFAAQRVPVAAPLPSRSGMVLHESRAEAGAFFASVFREAPGLSFSQLPAGSDWFFSKAGRTLASIHDAFDALEPQGSARFPWRSDLWDAFDRLVPRSETAAWGLFEELEVWLSSLPLTPPAFGLIHGDFTVANLRATRDEVTAFDFDASCRHWRAYDFACFLHAFGVRPEPERSSIYDAFLSGYAEARALTPDLVEQIPMFGKMRLLYSFLVFAKEWGFANLDEEQEAYFEHRRKLFGEPPSWPSSGRSRRSRKRSARV